MKNKLLTIVLLAVGATCAYSQADPENEQVEPNVTAQVDGEIAPSDTTRPTGVDLLVDPLDDDQESGKTEVSLNYFHESLSNDRGTWHEANLVFVHKFTTRKAFYGSYRETERFRLRDREASVGLYQPLDNKWTLLLEASASPTHRVLPKWSGMVQIERLMGDGWIAQAGYRRTELTEAKVNIAKLGFEKYWGMNRAAYTLSINNLENTGTAASQRVQYNRYYGGESSNIGVSFAFGREVEKISDTSVLQSQIYNVTASGKHSIDRNWAVRYGYTFHRQGTFYDRRGPQIGIVYKF